MIDTQQALQPSHKQKEYNTLVQPLLQILSEYQGGVEAHAQTVIASLFEEYYSVEHHFYKTREEALVNKLRAQFRGNHKKIYEIELSHFQLAGKNALMLALLRTIRDVKPFTKLLGHLSDLSGPGHREVSLEARHRLITCTLPSWTERYSSMETMLMSGDYDYLVVQPGAIFDVITAFFDHPVPSVLRASLDVYIRRAYHAYEISESSIFLPAEEPSIPPHERTPVSAEWFYSSGERDPNSPNLLTASVPPAPFFEHTRSPSDEAAIAMTRSPGLGKMARTNTDTDLVKLGLRAANNEGKLFVFTSEAHARAKFEECLASFNPVTIQGEGEVLNNVLKAIIIPETRKPDDDQTNIAKFYQFLKPYHATLREKGIRRVTIVLAYTQLLPLYYTFRERLDYQEHAIFRHVEPPLAYHLELRRLDNYHIELIPTDNKTIHLYFAEEIKQGKGEPHQSLFARAMVRGDLTSGSMDIMVAEAEHIVNECCNAIELALGQQKYRNAWNNHIFLAFLPEAPLNAEKVRGICQDMAARYWHKLGRVKVGEVELVGRLKLTDTGHPLSARFFINNPTSYIFEYDAYIDLKDPRTHRSSLSALFGSKKLDGKEVPMYTPPTHVQRKRMQALQNSTSYAYDYPALIEEALRREWVVYKQQHRGLNPTLLSQQPKQLVHARELILDAEHKGLVEVDRPYGVNDVAMVAWKMQLHTPEYPKGRTVIVIANDITVQIGSFGPLEDKVFYFASEQARILGVPRLYIAANSGARIGLAQEVKDRFRVEWQDPRDPLKGFRHFYLTEQDYQALKTSVKATKTAEDHYTITDIIGIEDGLGVENLRGSGMIAGETSRAYEETCTITLVTGRTVGIGAYLVRLGQRTIQNQGPIILTGASALNKVLGRDVYLSNVQLGGTQIMFANGVSHMVVNDDVQGLLSAVHWLGYVPEKRGAPLPFLTPVDPVDRLIDFVPTKSPYDPRHMLAGMDHNSVAPPTSTASAAAASAEAGSGLANGSTSSSSALESATGFFDRGSFTETLAGWGKTVVCGRARLGGIPVGVISVETRTVELILPADPAAADSTETLVQQAGMVWFPDSAYKTAQCIMDFNREELPLIIFANWRGFSGGLRDLYQEILKFGSYIVDALRTFKQPAIIYIPANAELRGGAWVVLDPTINPSKMEMYCDETGRGGVLEPAGTVEIKYKDKDVIVTMHRLDPELISLDAQLKAVKDAEERKKLEKRVREREASLMGMYGQVATNFADLHDTPGRMKEKEVIREVLQWRTSRTFLYHRINRRVQEEYLKREISTTAPSLSEEGVTDLLRTWLRVSEPTEADAIWASDARTAAWLTSKRVYLQTQLTALRRDKQREHALRLASVDPLASAEGLLLGFEGAQLAGADKELLRAHLQQLLQKLA